MNSLSVQDPNQLISATFIQLFRLGDMFFDVSGHSLRKVIKLLIDYQLETREVTWIHRLTYRKYTMRLISVLASAITRKYVGELTDMFYMKKLNKRLYSRKSTSPKKLLLNRDYYKEFDFETALDDMAHCIDTHNARRIMLTILSMRQQQPVGDSLEFESSSNGRLTFELDDVERGLLADQVYCTTIAVKRLFAYYHIDITELFYGTVSGLLSERATNVIRAVASTGLSGYIQSSRIAVYTLKYYLSLLLNNNHVVRDDICYVTFTPENDLVGLVYYGAQGSGFRIEEFFRTLVLVLNDTTILSRTNRVIEVYVASILSVEVDLWDTVRYIHSVLKSGESLKRAIKSFISTRGNGV